MIDPFGREITYLRVSVTDRCNFRCTYCMSDNMTFYPREDLLSLEEMDRLCSAFVKRGVRKIRITGGEPLVRRSVVSLLSSLGRHLKSGDLDEITLTTNASQLYKYAADIYASGIRRVNISLDTLDPETFRSLTRYGDLDRVLEGIQAAKNAGLKIKINTVALKGVNHHEAHKLVSWCGEEGFDLTFIETMPMNLTRGSSTKGPTDFYIPLSQVRSDLEGKWTLKDVMDSTGGPSRYVRIEETGQRVGFITPMSRHFCETCNRVRLTCTGTLYLCLGQNSSVDLRSALRASDTEESLLAAIDAAIRKKPKGHDFSSETGEGDCANVRNMNVTGG